MMDRKSIKLVAVFTIEPQDDDPFLRECCARADLVMMAVCDGTGTAADGAPYDLTPHELRLLGLMVEGHTYKAAARLLSITVNTVAFHIQNIYGKLNVHSKAEAVARALNEGLLLRRAS